MQRSATKDDRRLALAGIHLSLEAGKLTATAADGFRLSTAHMTLADPDATAMRKHRLCLQMHRPGTSARRLVPSWARPTTGNPSAGGTLTEPERGLSVREAAQWASVTQSTIRGWIKRGSLPAMGVGADRRIRLTDPATAQLRIRQMPGVTVTEMTSVPSASWP